MTVQGKEIIDILEAWAPKQLAYDWDNVGLQVGTLNKPISKVMISLDVLENVVDEAIEKQVNLIIAHHPLLFSALKSVNTNTPKGRVIEKLIKHDISVYAAHTNLDIACGGVSDILADKLGVYDTKVLIPDTYESLYKLVVYSPVSHAQRIKTALAESGAGHIGNYSDCFFESRGEGSFKPLAGTNPYIGKQGEEEKVEEARIETIVPDHLIKRAIEAVQEAHPYEEVAYDLIPLKNQGNPIGAGRIGQLPETMLLSDFCEVVKKKLEVSVVRVTGNLNEIVQKVAILGGSGKGFINQAKAMGADVYVTGDMAFHEAQDAEQMGLSVIDPGHYVEKVMKQAVQSHLQRQLKDANLDTEVIISNVSTDPFKFV